MSDEFKTSEPKTLPQYKQYQTLLKGVFDAFGCEGSEWEARNRKMKKAVEKGNDDALEKQIKAICKGIKSGSKQVGAEGTKEAWKNLESFLIETVSRTDNDALKLRLKTALEQRDEEVKKAEMMRLFLSMGLIDIGTEQMKAMFRESQKRVQSPSKAMLDRILEEAKETGEKYASSCANAVYDLEKWVWYQYFKAIFGMFSFIGIAISDDKAREIQPLDQQNEPKEKAVRVLPVAMKGK